MTFYLLLYAIMGPLFVGGPFDDEAACKKYAAEYIEVLKGEAVRERKETKLACVGRPPPSDIIESPEKRGASLRPQL